MLASSINQFDSFLLCDIGLMLVIQKEIGVFNYMLVSPIQWGKGGGGGEESPFFEISRVSTKGDQNMRN